MSRTEVVVVGAGPVGLCLALGLARSGRSVLLAEKEPSTAERSRAPAIWPRTQEILADLGVVDRFQRAGTLVPEVELWDADEDRVLLRLPLRELAGTTDHPHLLLLPQSETERLLREELEGEGTADVRFSTEVVGVDPARGDRVRVACRRDGRRETVSAPFVVGCDGAHSTVRESLGVDFGGQTYGMRAALADVRLPADRSWRSPRLTARERVAVGLRLRPPGPAGRGGLWRLVFPVLGDRRLPLDERIDRAVADLFSAARHTTVWSSEFRLHRRVAARFTAGRVALAGDAAHLNSPVGGQGMNSGIQDVAGLLPALDRALDRDDPGALERYGRGRRRAVREGVNRFTDRLTRMLFFGRGRFLKPTLRAVSLALRIPALRRRVLRRLAMIDREA